MGNNSSSRRFAIIPHAGKMFAGEMRKKVFSQLNKEANIVFFLAADHKGLGRGKTHIDLSLSLDTQEHSFRFVKDELFDHFSKARFVAIIPGSEFDGSACERYVLDTLKESEGSVLIGTTDLTHNGDRFGSGSGTGVGEPSGLNKILNEEEMIANLTRVRFPTDRLKLTGEKICGSNSVRAFVSMLRKLYPGTGPGLEGSVVDYYDSSAMRVRDVTKTKEDFVSYVGIVYGPPNPIPMLPPQFDVDISLSFLKAFLLLRPGLDSLHLPSWSVFHSLTNGVFVGTSVDGKTNCSVGEFEDGTSSTASKIIRAFRRCPADAEERWGVPYSGSGSGSGSLQYKIELLEPEDQWQIGYRPGPRFGTKIVLSSGRNATFLPSVASEFGSSQEYLKRLVLKAGGRSVDDIKEVYSYKTKVYKSRY